jgi:hypothetical protein
MVLWHGITGITRFCGGPRKSLTARSRIAWSRRTWDNPGMGAGGYRPVVMAALLSQAGGEPGRWL